MSVERSLEAWEEMQRQGFDIADRFSTMAQGFTCLLNTHIKKPTPFSWPPPEPPSLPFPDAGDSVSAILDIGNRLGRAGAEMGACIGGMVEQFFRHLPPLSQMRTEEKAVMPTLSVASAYSHGTIPQAERGDEGQRGAGFSGLGMVVTGDSEELVEEEVFDLNLAPTSSSSGPFGRSQGSINITSTYDSRIRGIESSVVARGDLWRVEASNGSSTSGNEHSPLFLVQLGPVLFVRDSTLLLPVHLSKQHLLWYGFDRKNGVHSICPAVWSKQRRWLLMSMICLNPIAFSFMDLQFPNGQVTYVAGEGLTTSAFFPILGGLLQTQGRYPGETRLSYSCKNKHGTRFTSTLQWPDNSFSLGIMQALAWKRSGLMVRPTIQFRLRPRIHTLLPFILKIQKESVCPTFGGSDPGVRAELIHSMREKLNLICGYACTTHPSAYASIAIGRSKWDGHVGNAGMVLRMEIPATNHGRPSFSVQLNSGLEF